MLVHDSVTALLQVLDPTFSIILVLLIGLQWLGRDCKDAQVFLDAFQNFNVGMIRK